MGMDGPLSSPWMQTLSDPQPWQPGSRNCMEIRLDDSCWFGRGRDGDASQVNIASSQLDDDDDDEHSNNNIILNFTIRRNYGRMKWLLSIDGFIEKIRDVKLDEWFLLLCTRSSCRTGKVEFSFLSFSSLVSSFFFFFLSGYYWWYK